MRRAPEKKQQQQQHEEGSPAELLKAVAQAWHAQSGKRKPTDEFHARRRSSDHRRPSRFKLEAVALAAAGSTWDFTQSLWDSYEIVMLSKKLEEVDLEPPEYRIGRTGKRSRESQNSLRSLLHRSSSSFRRQHKSS